MMMDKNILNIKLESEKYNFIIEEKSISKIYVVLPFLRDAILGNLSQSQDGFCLHLCDRIASSCVENKKYINWFYSPNLFTKTIHIFVPNSSISSINIHLENGNLFLHKIHAQRVNISDLRGNIKIKNSNISSSIIEGYQSEIVIENLEGNHSDISSKTGNLKIKGMVSDRNKLETILGDICLYLNDQDLDYTQIDMKSKTIKSSLEPKKELRKTIDCFAPYGSISGNFL